MNRINYFQQGGTAPQQDVQQQIVALVQAAMQGDQKATQTVNQIMEAAQKGDPKAIQLAQLIQEVAKQMQGQATTAKWGAKLSYIKSLKYAKGGKACPACEKKVEIKACGGKKAKKHQKGGVTEKNNIVTTPKYWYKVEQVASGSTDPDVNGMMPRRVIYTYGNSMPNDTLYFANALAESKANLGPAPTTTQKQQFGRESMDARVFNGMLQKSIKKRYFGGWL